MKGKRMSRRTIWTYSSTVRENRIGARRFLPLSETVRKTLTPSSLIVEGDSHQYSAAIFDDFNYVVATHVMDFIAENNLCSRQ